MRRPLAVVLLALLAGCATAPGLTGRPSTLSDLLLALDTSEKMGGDPRCRSRSLSATEVVVPVELTAQGVSGRWTERWTVDRCGMAVPYVVKFDRAPDGDLDVSMQREVSEAGPEARCRIRKVVGTEVLAPVEGGQVEGDRPIAGRWVERWTLDRCGTSVAYMIRFTTTPKGTTFIAELQR